MARDMKLEGDARVPFIGQVRRWNGEQGSGGVNGGAVEGSPAPCAHRAAACAARRDVTRRGGGDHAQATLFRGRRRRAASTAIGRWRVASRRVREASWGRAWARARGGAGQGRPWCALRRARSGASLVRERRAARGGVLGSGQRREGGAGPVLCRVREGGRRREEGEGRRKERKGGKEKEKRKKMGKRKRKRKGGERKGKKERGRGLR